MQRDPGPSTGKRKRTDENTADERNSKRPTPAPNESDDDEIVPVQFSSSSTSFSTPLSPSPFPDFLPSTTVSASSSFSTYHQHRTPTPTPTPTPPPPPPPETLSEYTCPICFSPPTNATITPCGHICCGACLFTAVKTTLHRGAMTFTREPNIARFVLCLVCFGIFGADAVVVRCPVCRAPIPGWDGRGGGVIGLRPRVVITL